MKNLSLNSIPKTLSESVYKNLRSGIINNKLKAGQRIYEELIAEMEEICKPTFVERNLKNW
jgi:DNA-binding GntR family transcriptional regulator